MPVARRGPADLLVTVSRRQLPKQSTTARPSSQIVCCVCSLSLLSFPLPHPTPRSVICILPFYLPPLVRSSRYPFFPLFPISLSLSLHFLFTFLSLSLPFPNPPISFWKETRWSGSTIATRRFSSSFSCQMIFRFSFITKTRENRFHFPSALLK